MGSDRDRKHAGPPPVVSQLINVDEAWAQPLGPLDLVTLAIEGAALSPVFSPTIVQYEAHPDAAAAPRRSPAEPVTPVALALELVAEPARRGMPLQVASPTGTVEELGQCRFRFRGRPGRAHHLTITVGWPQGPSRTTVVAVRDGSDVAPDGAGSDSLRAGDPVRR